MDRFSRSVRTLLRSVVIPAALVAALAVAAIDARPVYSRLRFAADPFATHDELSQETLSDDENAIPSEQVDKYIAVYTAMQRDHTLTVEQAAERQGLTITAFRQLENRIERNSVVHERVLEALRSAAKERSKDEPPAEKPK